MIDSQPNQHTLLHSEEVKMSLDVNISEPDEFNCIELHDSIKKVATLKNFDNFSYHVDLVCGKGGNYIANVFRVLIKENESENIASVIVKTLINTSRKGLFSDIHSREVNAYTKIISQINNIQSVLDETDRIVLPECIVSNIDKGNEVIILEDLMLLGFEINDKLLAYENLDYSQVKLVLIYLAKFHALSFIYESREQIRFNDLRREFDDILYKNSFLNKSKLKDYFFESFGMSLNLIEDNTTRKKLDVIKEKLLVLLRMYTSPKKYNSFCHGDCWLNNILYKKNETETEVCLVDFQTMRYANPITDILHFLYISTDSKFRSEHLEELITCYYTTFQTFLILFDMKADELYPEDEFRKDFKELHPYGLLVAMIELRVATTNPDDEVLLRKLLKYDYSGVESGILKFYQLRVNDVCFEFEQNGVLDKLMYLVNSLE